MTDEQYKNISAKIDELTETFKSQSAELRTQNKWLRGIVIFVVSFGLTSILIKVIL